MLEFQILKEEVIAGGWYEGEVWINESHDSRRWWPSLEWEGCGEDGDEATGTIGQD